MSSDLGWQIRGALERVLESDNVETPNGDDANIVDAVAMVARALHELGNADAATPMGAIEAHGKAVKESGEEVASGLRAVSISLDEIADQIRYVGDALHNANDK